MIGKETLSPLKVHCDSNIQNSAPVVRPRLFRHHTKLKSYEEEWHESFQKLELLSSNITHGVKDAKWVESALNDIFLELNRLNELKLQRVRGSLSTLHRTDVEYLDTLHDQYLLLLTKILELCPISFIKEEHWRKWIKLWTSTLSTRKDRWVILIQQLEGIRRKFNEKGDEEFISVRKLFRQENSIALWEQLSVLEGVGYDALYTALTCFIPLESEMEEVEASLIETDWFYRLADVELASNDTTVSLKIASFILSLSKNPKVCVEMVQSNWMQVLHSWSLLPNVGLRRHFAMIVECICETGFKEDDIDAAAWMLIRKDILQSWFLPIADTDEQTRKSIERAIDRLKQLARSHQSKGSLNEDLSKKLVVYTTDSQVSFKDPIQ